MSLFEAFVADFWDGGAISLPLSKPRQVLLSHQSGSLGLVLLLEGIFYSPLNLYWVFDTIYQYLVLHGFPGKLGTDSVLIFDVDKETALVKDNVFNLSPGAELFVDKSNDVLGGVFSGNGLPSRRISVEVTVIKLDATHTKDLAIFRKRAYARAVFFECRMAATAEDVLHVVGLCRRYVFHLRDAMVEAAVDTFSAAAASEVDAEGGLASLFEPIGLREASVDLWAAAVERRNPHLAGLFVLQELVIPDVVITVAFLISTFLD